MTSLYDLTIPMLVRALQEQITFLKKGEAWCEETNYPKEKLLEGKLAEDMKPLTFQVQRCSDTAKGATVRLGSEAEVSLPDTEKTFPELYARLEKTIEILKAAKAEGFKKPEETFNMKIGPYEFDFTAIKYVQNYLIPNYFFHQMASYAILRNAGVPVGKRDYLGAASMTGA